MGGGSLLVSMTTRVIECFNEQIFYVSELLSFADRSYDDIIIISPICAACENVVSSVERRAFMRTSTKAFMNQGVRMTSSTMTQISKWKRFKSWYILYYFWQELIVALIFASNWYHFVSHEKLIFNACTNVKPTRFRNTEVNKQTKKHAGKLLQYWNSI